jgi:hypothetical protein
MREMGGPPCACGCGKSVCGRRPWGVGKIIWNKYANKECMNSRYSRQFKISGDTKYIGLYLPCHGKASLFGYVYEHVFIAEKALGKSLPKGVNIHHVDEDPGNNANSNLVICQDQSYHLLLHSRRDALLACGNPNWRRCTICKKYDDPTIMVKANGKGVPCHWECRREASSKAYRKKIGREVKAIKSFTPEEIQASILRRTEPFRCGHPLTYENVYLDKYGYLHCRICRLAAGNRRENKIRSQNSKKVVHD